MDSSDINRRRPTLRFPLALNFHSQSTSVAHNFPFRHTILLHLAYNQSLRLPFTAVTTMSVFLYSEPSRHLASLGRMRPGEFSNLFEHGPMKTCVRGSQAVVNTAVDVKETPDAFHFVADLPGLKREEVKVQVEENNVLTISGERIREKKERTGTYHRLERSSGKFLRRFGLPSNANVSKIAAKCEDGVLSVTVPKIPPREPEKPKVIDVQIA